jgi:hypothetical protein
MDTVNFLTMAASAEALSQILYPPGICGPFASCS